MSDLGANPSLAPSREVRIDGGVVAYNEEGHVGDALRSLLSQRLPPGRSWGTIWVVASGCTDRTAEVSRSFGRPIQVIEQPSRHGKSAALMEVIRRCDARSLVLLNADARAGPDAVRALSEATSGIPPPFAASARPALPRDFPRGGFADSVRLLWEVHDRFQRSSAVEGALSNLSDELLLLSGDSLPTLPEGLVNDGGFIAAWLRRVGGSAIYVPDAIVEIEAPIGLGPYVRQRRRIRFGSAQVERLTGVAPSSAQRSLISRPRRVWRMVRAVARETAPGGWSPLAGLIGAESMALVAASWDRLIPGVDHVRWATLPE